jgi:hypothetical protein
MSRTAARFTSKASRRHRLASLPPIKDANLAALAIKDQMGCLRVAYGRVLHSLPKSTSVQHTVEVFTSEYAKQKAQLLAAKPAIAP